MLILSSLMGRFPLLGNKYGFLKPLLKGGHKGDVLCRGPLEEYGVSDAAFNGHLCEVVFPDGMKHGGKHLK